MLSRILTPLARQSVNLNICKRYLFKFVILNEFELISCTFLLIVFTYFSFLTSSRIVCILHFFNFMRSFLKTIFCMKSYLNKDYYYNDYLSPIEPL